MVSGVGIYNYLGPFNGQYYIADLDYFIFTMATEAGKLNIEVPNFTKILLDAIKDALIAGFHKLPYSDTPYYLYALYTVGGFVILAILFWWWSNFFR